MTEDQLAAVFRTFEWTVQHVRNQAMQEQRSHILRNDDTDFRVRLVPYNSDAERAARGGVSIFLDVMSDPPQHACIVKFVLTIRNQRDGNLSVTMDEEKLLETGAREDIVSWGFPRFISQDLLLDPSAGYCIDGRIVIEALISVQKLRSSSAAFSASAASDSDAAGRGRAIEIIRNQRHPIMLLVASSDDLRKHVGPGLVNFDRVLKFSVAANMPATELRDKLSREVLEDAAILPCHLVEVPRGHTVDIQKPLRDIQISRNSVQDLVRPLGSREWRVIALKREHVVGMDEGGILVFLKFFDTQARSLELVGNFVLEQSAAMSTLLPKVNELVGLMPTEPLLIWLDTGNDSPQALQESQTCQQIGLVSGSVLCFQKKAPLAQAGTEEAAAAQGLVAYLAGFSDRSALSLHPLHQSGQLLSLNVGSRTSGTQLLAEISRNLCLGAGTHVSIFQLDPYLGGPRACAVPLAQLPGPLSTLLLTAPPVDHSASNRSPSRILYYEVRNNSTSVDRAVNISWFGPQVAEERVFSLTVTNLTTVGEVLGRLRQMGPLRGTGDLRLVGTWRHRIVWVAGGGGGGEGFACGEESETLSSINSQVTLRAEEVADDAFGSLPHQRLVQVTHMREAGERGEVQFMKDPFLLSVSPQDTVQGVWARITTKLGLGSSLSLACISPGSAPLVLEKDASFLLQHLAVAAGSYLAIVHPQHDDDTSPRERGSRGAVAANNPSRYSHQQRAPAPCPDNPAAPPQLPTNQPGLWARLSAAVEEERQPEAASEPAPESESPPQPAASNPVVLTSNPLTFPLPIPHSSDSSQRVLPRPPSVDRSADLAFELETVKSDLMEERLMVEGLEAEVRRLTGELIDERNARHRAEESLDDAQVELASAVERREASARELEVLKRKLDDFEKKEAHGGSAVDIIKNVTDNQVQHASVPTLNMLEIAAKDLLAKVFQVRSTKKGVPDSFLCPITQELMKDPVVVVQTGHTYERTAIARWFENNSSDPKTNVALDSKAIIPNHGLRATIEEYLLNR